MLIICSTFLLISESIEFCTQIVDFVFKAYLGYKLFRGEEHLRFGNR